jgi:DHA2 family multidrug resistance protein
MIVIAAATIGAIASLAPTLGPTVGGWITENYSWHWLFFVNPLPGIFVAVVVPILVRVDEPQPSLPRGADYPFARPQSSPASPACSPAVSTCAG